jgi:23S rRNA (guanosine2251-2'-O)-methyltransferase
MTKMQNIIFGIHPVLEALKGGQNLDKVLLKRGLDKDTSQQIESELIKSGIPYQYVPMEKLNRLTRRQHQGIIAFVSLIEYADLDEILIRTIENAKPPLVLLLDGITDVRNFGAIARSAECAGVDAIVISASGSAPIGGDAMKTSAGALEHIPVCRYEKLQVALKLLHTYGIQVLALSEHGSEDIYGCNLRLPTAFVMGAEGRGISHTILRISEQIVKISVFGKISSLNVSAAASIALFEAIRQRRM